MIGYYNILFQNSETLSRFSICVTEKTDFLLTRLILMTLGAGMQDVSHAYVNVVDKVSESTD